MFLVPLMMCALARASPFGGWGPGEGFGHLGKRPPPNNPNSNFGYDFFGTTHNRFNYSAVVMKHNEPRSMRDPKFVSVAAEVKHLKKTYIRPGPNKSFKKHSEYKSDFQSKKPKVFRNGRLFPDKSLKTSPPSKLSQINSSKDTYLIVNHSCK